MVSKNKVFHNFLALGTGEALSRLIAFGVTIYLARLLGADGYGIIAFAIAINLYLLKVADFSLEWVGTEIIAKSPKSVSELASALLCARLMLTLALIIVSSVITWLVLPDPERKILLLYFLVLVPTALNTKWIHIGLEDARPVGISKVLGESLNLLIITALVRQRDDLWVAPVAQACGEVLIASLLILTLRRRSYKFGLKWNPDVFMPIFSKAAPLLGHLLLGLMIYNSDLIFLRFYYNSENVGFYAVSFTLIGFIANLGMAYGMSVMPTFARLINDEKEEKSFYHSTLARLFAVTLPIAIGGYLLASNIIGLAFGDGYSSSIITLQIIIWTIPFNILRIPPWGALIARNHQHLLFKAMLYAAIANLMLNVLLIPSYGVTGAAISTVITEILISMILFANASSLGLGFISPKRFVKPVIAGLIMAASLIIVNPYSAIVGTLLGCVIYILVLSLIRGINYKKGALPSLNL